VLAFFFPIAHSLSPLAFVFFFPHHALRITNHEAMLVSFSSESLITNH